jgi:hypothetical protein
MDTEPQYFRPSLPLPYTIPATLTPLPQIFQARAWDAEIRGHTMFIAS